MTWKKDVNFNTLSKFPSSCDCFFWDYTYRLMAGCLTNDNSTREGISMHSFDDFETHYISVGFFGMHWYGIPLISEGIAATLCTLYVPLTNGIMWLGCSYFNVVSLLSWPFKVANETGKLSFLLCWMGERNLPFSFLCFSLGYPKMNSGDLINLIEGHTVAPLVHNFSLLLQGPSFIPFHRVIC